MYGLWFRPLSCIAWVVQATFIYDLCTLGHFHWMVQTTFIVWPEWFRPLSYMALVVKATFMYGLCGSGHFHV